MSEGEPFISKFLIEKLLIFGTWNIDPLLFDPDLYSYELALTNSAYGYLINGKYLYSLISLASILGC